MIYGLEIDYEILFDGFITLNFEYDYMPITHEPIVFTSKEEWNSFGLDYLPNHYELIYSYITLNSNIDFSKYNILYYNIASPNSWYDISYQIDKIILTNNELVFKFKDEPDYKISVLNQTSIKHSYILILKIKKEDTPKKLKNLYKTD